MPPSHPSSSSISVLAVGLSAPPLLLRSSCWRRPTAACPKPLKPSRRKHTLGLQTGSGQAAKDKVEDHKQMGVTELANVAVRWVGFLPEDHQFPWHHLWESDSLRPGVHQTRRRKLKRSTSLQHQGQRPKNDDGKTFTEALRWDVSNSLIKNKSFHSQSQLIWFRFLLERADSPTGN